MCMALEPWWRQPMPSDKANCCREGFFMIFCFWCRFKRSRACFSFQMRSEHYFNSVSTSWTAPISLYLENRHSDHLQSCIWHMGMHAQFKRHESIKPRCGAVRGETGVLWHCPAQQRLRLDLNMHLSRQCTHNRFFNFGRGIAWNCTFRIFQIQLWQRKKNIDDPGCPPSLVTRQGDDESLGLRGLMFRLLEPLCL